MPDVADDSGIAGLRPTLAGDALFRLPFDQVDGAYRLDDHFLVTSRSARPSPAHPRRLAGG